MRRCAVFAVMLVLQLALGAWAQSAGGCSCGTHPPARPTARSMPNSIKRRRKENRAYSRKLLTTIPFTLNSDDFVFDNQMIAQICFAGYEIAEITCPTKYFKDASSINIRNSTVYGFGVLKTSVLYRLNRWRILKSPLFFKERSDAAGD